jgi:hypothetical protein
MEMGIVITEIKRKKSNGKMNERGQYIFQLIENVISNGKYTPTVDS